MMKMKWAVPNDTDVRDLTHPLAFAVRLCGPWWRGFWEGHLGSLCLWPSGTTSTSVDQADVKSSLGSESRLADLLDRRTLHRLPLCLFHALDGALRAVHPGTDRDRI